MDDLNTPAPTPEPTDWRNAVQSLQSLLTSLLIFVLVISGTLNLFFLRQWRGVHSELAGVQKMVNDYEKVTMPMVNDLARKLVEYERSHPDFAPISAKFGLKSSLASAPGAQAPAPASKTKR